MKIGILTHSLGYNYGGLLQNYALQKILEKLGHEPITLNHQPRSLSLKRKLLSIGKRLIHKVIGGNLPIVGFTTSSQLKYITRYINEFKERCIIKSDSVNLSKLQSIDDIKSLKAIVVGSDQVWRYKMMGNEILEMFLFSFKTYNIKKLSYAASFGTNIWEMPSQITRQARMLLSKFNAVSVREHDAVKMCSEYLGVDPKLVLDPTLLLSSEEYLEILDGCPFKLVDKPNSLMTYILDRNDVKSQIINSIIERSNLIKNEVYPQSKFANVGKKNIDKCVYPSVEEWIKGFYDAEMVITDSFHGTAFSIIFNKPFWVIGNEKRGLSRFESLLSLFGLQNRLIKDCPKNIYEPIDWTNVNIKLKYLKEESINFLKENL